MEAQIKKKSTLHLKQRALLIIKGLLRKPVQKMN
jgi:hypothetical protein